MILKFFDGVAIEITRTKLSSILGITGQVSPDSGLGLQNSPQAYIEDIGNSDDFFEELKLIDNVDLNDLLGDGSNDGNDKDDSEMTFDFEYEDNSKNLLQGSSGPTSGISCYNTLSRHSQHALEYSNSKHFAI